MSAGTELAGWDAVFRNREDSAATAYVVILDSRPITRDGFVTRWFYYPKADQPFKTMVFRPTGVTTFTIVGINDITGGTINTANTVTVNPCERIRVQTGDVIGLAWGTGTSPQTAWNNDGPTVASVRWRAYAGSYTIGMPITTTGMENREWSLQAEITDFGDLPTPTTGKLKNK